mgnify:FL=1
MLVYVRGRILKEKGKPEMVDDVLRLPKAEHIDGHRCDVVRRGTEKPRRFSPEGG